MTPEQIHAANDELTRAYRQCFGSPAGRAVMADLMTFCHFRVEANGEIEEGQRRVFLRIMNLSTLTNEQLQRLYGGHDIGDSENG